LGGYKYFINTKQYVIHLSKLSRETNDETLLSQTDFPLPRATRFLARHWLQWTRMRRSYWFKWLSITNYETWLVGQRFSTTM